MLKLVCFCLLDGLIFLCSFSNTYFYFQGMYVSQFSALQGCDDDEGDDDEPVVGNVVTENTGRQSAEEESQDADINTRWQLGKLIG